MSSRGSPHRRLEDVAEPLRLLTGREVEIDEHAAVVVRGVLHPLVAHAILPAALGEPVEGGLPGGQVAGRVLDVQGDHGREARDLAAAVPSQGSGVL